MSPRGQIARPNWSSLSMVAEKPPAVSLIFWKDLTVP
jgi:hypothetical protein